MTAFDQLFASVESDLDHYFGPVDATIVYRRGTDAVELVATPRSAANMVDAEYGIIIPENFMRFTVSPSDLILGGALATPAVGDEIDLHRDGTVKTYRVTVPPGGQNCYRLDTTGALLTIFGVEQ